MPTANLPRVLVASAAVFVGTASAFVRHHAPLPAVAPASRRGRTVMSMKTGIFYASISGSAEELADRLKDELGDDAHGPFDVSDEDDFSVADLMSYDSIICGLPTYNTGADVMRSGTVWDELFYEAIAELDFKGKNVACFGVGDQEGYGDNFAEGVGEIHDVLHARGATMFGYTDASAEAGYEHGASKTERDGKFVGLVCDAVSQDELTDGRVEAWCAQLKTEGFFAGLKAANGKANGVANGVANGKANGVANDAYHLRSEELQKAAALDSRWGAEEVARINGAAAAAGAWAPQDASASLELLDAIDAKYGSAPAAAGGHNHAYVVRNKDAHALSGRWGAEELHRIVKA